MSLLRIQHEHGSRQIFIAAGTISDLATLEISPLGNRCVISAVSNPERVCGVARGSVVSGAIVYAVIDGVVSGVICGAAVEAGDRVMIASGGRITPLNSVTPGGAVSGYVPAPTFTGENYTPAGVVSGYVPAPTVNLVSGGLLSGDVLVGVGGTLACASGPVTGLTGVQAPQFGSGSFVGTVHTLSGSVSAPQFGSGSFAGTAFDTARVLGKALASGGAGSGIPIMVTLGG